VVKTKSLLLLTKSPVVFAGLFCVLLLYGCQAATPEEVTTKFWQALAQGQIETARTQVTENTQHLVTLNDIAQHSTVKTGEVIIAELDATVETIITRNDKPVSFDTVLLKEKDSWKVDYQQTRINISMIPFDGIAKSLQNLGDSFAKQLEESAPLIEKEMESLGNELKEQIDEFGRSLGKPQEEKPQNPGKPKPYPGTI
jgi:hypothetical protein